MSEELEQNYNKFMMQTMKEGHRVKEAKANTVSDDDNENQKKKKQKED
jgi:hypothetical protein